MPFRTLLLPKWSAVCLVLCVLHIPARCDVQISGSDLTVSTRSVSLQLRGTTLLSFSNLLTGENYVSDPRDVFLGVALQDQQSASLIPQMWRLEPDGQSGQTAILESGDGVHVARWEMSVDSITDEIIIKISASSAQPGLISSLWAIQGLELAKNRLVIPAQSGMYYNLKTPVKTVAEDYPVHWESPFVIYEASGGGFIVSARDPSFQFKRLHGSRDTGSLVLGFEVFAPGPWSGSYEVSRNEWRIRGFSGNWKLPADEYRTWFRSILPIESSDGPRSWVKQIRGVATVQTLDTAVLELLATRVDPTRTLILLVDWRESSFDLNYPDYMPSSRAKPFVEKAHELGFRVMLHTNLLGVSTTHPAFESMKRYQLRSADTLTEQGWLWYNLPEGDPRRFAFISPASAEFRKLFIDNVRLAVEELNPDALHLDAGSGILNDGNGLIDGLNTTQGIVQFHKELIQAFPNLVFGGESTNELVAPFNWFAQRWTAPTPTHPISTYLFGDKVHFYGFLDQPDPDEAGYASYVQRYEGQGVLPTPIITSTNDLSEDRKRMSSLLGIIKQFQQYQFEPDWGSDWAEQEIFRYRSLVDDSIAVVDREGPIVRFKVSDNIAYERVTGVTELETPYFVQAWAAWDDQRIFGLDSSRQYWLDPVDRPHELLRLENLPSRLKVGLDSYATASYGLFQLDSVPPAPYSFFDEFESTRKGTQYGRVDYPVINGATISIQRMFAGSQLSNATIFMSPPYRRVLGGASYVEFDVPIPIASSVSFLFDYAISDGAPRGDGAWMAVWIDGVEAWRGLVTAGQWHSNSVDLSAYSGRTVKLRILTHAGPNNNPVGDWTGWSNLRIEVDGRAPGSLLNIRVPSTHINSVESNAPITQAQDGLIQVQADMPGILTVFADSPHAPALGQNLLDFPFDVWQAGYQNHPRPGAYDGSGEVKSAKVGGVTIDRAIVAHPPRAGYTILTLPVRIPEDANLLNFKVGLAEAPPPFPPEVNYSGVTFQVKVNGESLWNQEVHSSQWVVGQADLAKWRGKSVVLQLITDSLNTPIFDWSKWADIVIY